MRISKIREAISDIPEAGKTIRSHLLQHKWAAYFTIMMLVVIYLIIQGIQEIVWTRYYASVRATEFLREAKFSPGSQPDATAAGTLNAVWATLHAAYAAAYFSVASLLLGISAALYTYRSVLLSAAKDLKICLRNRTFDDW